MSRNIEKIWNQISGGITKIASRTATPTDMADYDNNMITALQQSHYSRADALDSIRRDQQATIERAFARTGRPVPRAFR